MNVICYGDNTKEKTGHDKDMHYGAATLSWHRDAGGYVVPGVIKGVVIGNKDRALNYGVKVIDEAEARELIVKLNKIIASNGGKYAPVIHLKVKKPIPAYERA